MRFKLTLLILLVVTVHFPATSKESETSARPVVEMPLIGVDLTTTNDKDGVVIKAKFGYENFTNKDISFDLTQFTPVVKLKYGKTATVEPSKVDSTDWFSHHAGSYAAHLSFRVKGVKDKDEIESIKIVWSTSAEFKFSKASNQDKK